MSTVTHPFIYDDLLQSPDDGLRYEIIDGELFVSPAATPWHQEVSGNLMVALGHFVWPARLGKVYPGPVNVVFDRYNVAAPDIVVVSSSRKSILSQLAIEGAPDLIVETLSSLSREMDLRRKAALYAAYGVPEYWIADPESQRLTILTLIDGLYEVVSHVGDIARSRILRGLEINVLALFDDVWWPES